MVGSHNRPLVISAVLLMLVSGAFPLPAASDGQEVSRALETEWIDLASYNGTVEVQAGRQYYIEFDPAERSFEPVELPAMDAGFSLLTKQAIDSVPDWIRPNLTFKFSQIGDVALSIGPFASPSVGDIDQDGDLDLVVGDDNGVRFYVNVGTAEWPVFVSEPGISLEGDFFGDPGEGGLGRWAPTLGDLNNDGHPDLILGNGEGTLYQYDNTATSIPPQFDGPYPIGTVDVGSNGHPDLGDLDQDGDLDLVIGNDRGTVSYYENTGTLSEPDFTFRPMRFQGMEVGSDSTPTLTDLDDDEDLDMVIGSASSGLFYYRNVAGTFILDVSVFAGLTIGDGSSPMLVDLYPDRTLDLYVGLGEGRVMYFDNIGTSRDPQWKSWSSFDFFEGVSYYPRYEYLRIRSHGITDRYADLIVKASTHLRDEIGFSIANTAPEVLRALNVTQAELFVENVQYIYAIDELVDYAELVEKTDHTTIRYSTKVNGQTVERDLPREIYYWYVVHPQITDEVSHYIDPDTGAPADPDYGGRFWREYLFYHADTAYPNLPGYPNNTGPPLMEDLLDGVGVLWNGTTWRAPGDRSGQYGDHALIRVSNWVGLTLILNEQEAADGERPIQPVRIAHVHNGNCGELQDLTVAAARTALIPARGVSMPGEDHVWIEFYEDGWHQWDNYWSHGGSIIDNYMNYWNGWGERGGGGIFGWMGNDATFEVTRNYVDPADVSKITFEVMDRNGDPVDGARVVVASHWLLQSDTDPVEVTIPFPTIFNYTDYDGRTTLYLAAQEDVRDANKNFSFKVMSRVGQAEQGKTELEQGEDYTFEFALEGSVPRPMLDPPVVPLTEGEARLELELTKRDGIHFPLNPVDGRTQPVVVRPSDTPGRTPMAFVVNATNLDLYLKGLDFESLGIIDVNGTGAIDVPADEGSFIIFSTEGVVEASRSISFTVKALGLLRSPDLTIMYPSEGASFPKGALVNITGTAGDPYDITNLEISTDGGDYFRNIKGSLVNGSWEYKYYTAGEPVGEIGIVVKATNGLGLTTARYVNITLEELDLEDPQVRITSPKSGATFDEGAVIKVRGTASDNREVSSLGLSLNDGGSWIDITDKLVSGTWAYDWDTRGKAAGGYSLISKASDLSGNEASHKIVVNIKGEEADTNDPSVSITRPVDGYKVTAGNIVIFEGKASDDVAVAELVLTIGGTMEKDLSHKLSQGKWSQEWHTAADDIGTYSVTVTATDASGNSGKDMMVVHVVEEGGDDNGPNGPDIPTEPDRTRPDLELFEPVHLSKIKKGDLLVIYGKAVDDSGSVSVFLYVNGKVEDITDQVKGGYFSHVISTEDFEPGLHIIAVKAIDPSDNEEEVSVQITVTKGTVKEEGLSDILSKFPPEVCFILVVLALVLVAAMSFTIRRRRMEQVLQEQARREKVKKRRKRRKKRKKK